MIKKTLITLVQIIFLAGIGTSLYKVNNLEKINNEYKNKLDSLKEITSFQSKNISFINTKNFELEVKVDSLSFSLSKTKTLTAAMNIAKSQSELRLLYNQQLFEAQEKRDKYKEKMSIENILEEEYQRRQKAIRAGRLVIIKTK